MSTAAKTIDPSPRSQVIQAGELTTFFIDAPGGSPPTLALHGLSSNAHAFGGLIAAGLSPAFRVIAPDLRGRARSGKPASGYTMGDHAHDIIALLDALHLDRVVVAGHSFGGYLGIYLAANHPDRFEKLIVIDAAITSHPRIGVMLKPSLDRLTRVASSTHDYLEQIRTAPYLDGAWDEHVEEYFRAEIVENPDGTAQSATSAQAVAQAAAGIAIEPWLHLVQQVRQPTLLINALGSYGPPEVGPLMDAVSARATARAFSNAKYVVVPGNHLTMVFGEPAKVVKREIEQFIRH